MKSRENIPIDEDDLAVIDAIRTPGTPEHEAAGKLLGMSPGQSSKAAVLAKVLHTGIVAIQEKVQEAGYAAYAASYDDEDRAFDQAMRRRGRQRSTEEEE